MYPSMNWAVAFALSLIVSYTPHQLPYDDQTGKGTYLERTEGERKVGFHPIRR
jgi:hypothetical protein